MTYKLVASHALFLADMIIKGERFCWRCKKNLVTKQSPTCRQCNTERTKLYRKTTAGTVATKKAANKCRLKYPEKTRARSKLNIAVKRGEIKKPEHCSSCGEKKKLEGHHEDYTKPLDVAWICRQCHSALAKPRSYAQPAPRKKVYTARMVVHSSQCFKFQCTMCSKHWMISKWMHPQTILKWYQADFSKELIKTKCVSCQIKYNGRVPDICNMCKQEL